MVCPRGVVKRRTNTHVSCQQLRRTLVVCAVTLVECVDLVVSLFTRRKVARGLECSMKEKPTYIFSLSARKSFTDNSLQGRNLMRAVRTSVTRVFDPLLITRFVCDRPLQKACGTSLSLGRKVLVGRTMRTVVFYASKMPLVVGCRRKEKKVESSGTVCVCGAHLLGW